MENLLQKLKSIQKIENLTKESLSVNKKLREVLELNFLKKQH